MKYITRIIIILTLMIVIISSTLKNKMPAEGIGDFYFVTVATTLVTATTQLDNANGPLDGQCVNITECDQISTNACIVRQNMAGYNNIIVGGPKS